MIAISQGLNLGVGIAAAILAVMCFFHLHWRLRFNPAQERMAIGLFAWTMAIFAVNVISTGFLATAANIERVNEGFWLPALLPLVSKVLFGMSLWVMIFWVLFWFWPSQERR